MLRFLHISDTHIDYKPQLEYVRNPDDILRERLNGLYNAINYAISNEIHLIVHSGDVFNVSSPKINYIYELQKVFSYAQDKGIEFIVIAGNHDQAKTKSALNVLKVFEIFKNVHIWNIQVWRLRIFMHSCETRLVARSRIFRKIFKRIAK